MIYRIKDIVDIYCFSKKQQKNTDSASCLVSLKQIIKFLYFSFKTVEKFSNSKSRSPGKGSCAKTRLPGIENVRIPGGLGRRRGGGGDGQAWN